MAATPPPQGRVPVAQPGQGSAGSWPGPRLIHCCYFKGSETIFLHLSSPGPGAGSKGNVSLVKKGTTEEALNAASALPSGSRAVSWESRASSQPPARRASHRGMGLCKQAWGELAAWGKRV